MSFMNETREKISRLTEEIRSAEREMYHVEDDEFFDWDRIEDPMKELAGFGRTGHVEPVRDAFRALIQNCSSGVTFAFAGQYSILTAPYDVEPVLEQLDERMQDDLERLENEFDTFKKQPDALVDLHSDRFWFYHNHFFPYLCQFLRLTERSIDPACIDRQLNNTIPEYVDRYSRIRAYVDEEEMDPGHPVFLSFRTTLSSFPELLQSLYSSLFGIAPDNINYPVHEYFVEDRELRELPEVPEEFLAWIQNRWEDHRPADGAWTPDPFDGENPLKHMEDEWTFELDPSNQ